MLIGDIVQLHVRNAEVPESPSGIPQDKADIIPPGKIEKVIRPNLDILEVVDRTEVDMDLPVVIQHDVGLLHRACGVVEVPVKIKDAIVLGIVLAARFVILPVRVLIVLAQVGVGIQV